MAKKSGAQQRKRKAAASSSASKAPDPPSSPPPFGTPNAHSPFTFTSPLSSSPSASTSTSFPPPPASRTTKPTSVSSSDASSSEEDDDESHHPEADEEEPPRELTAEERAAKAESLKEQGNAFFKTREYPTATRLYSQAIELAPQNPAYYTNRAASYMASSPGRYGLALQDCLTASGLPLLTGEGRTKCLLRQARCQLALGLYLEASLTLIELPEGTTGLEGLRLKAGKLRGVVERVRRDRERGEWGMVSMGVEELAREVEETPREWRGWRVEALVRRGKWEEASGLAADLLRQNQKNPEALYYRALCLYYSGNHPQAIAHAQEALRNDPDFVDARTLLKKVKLLDALKDSGNEFFKSSQFQSAINKYSEALGIVDEENKDYRSVLLSNRGTGYYKLKSYDLAIADCTLSLTLSPTYYKALRTRARVYLAQENWEEAVRDFKQAFELAPAGSVDERGLKGEVGDAEGKLKRSRMKDHYKTLGIHTLATDDEIKKAYRRQSLIHHPDKGGSEDKFKEIGESYAILSDPVRRRKFDSGIDENDPTGGMDPHDHYGHSHSPFGGGGGMNFEDMFGGGGYGGGRRGGGNPYGF